MKRILSSMMLAAAVAALAAPVQAQNMGGNMSGGMGAGNMPMYTTWQPMWDHGKYDRKHVVLGRVVSFTPYRLTVQRRDGTTQTVDLRNGTVIRPRGMTPQAGERVAMVGHWSGGTFVVGRLVLRP